MIPPAENPAVAALDQIEGGDARQGNEMGLRQRQLENDKRRAEGKEPEPGCGLSSGIKRWMRYHKRVSASSVKIKHPERYLHPRRLRDLSTDAKFDALRAAIG